MEDAGTQRLKHLETWLKAIPAWRSAPAPTYLPGRRCFCKTDQKDSRDIAVAGHQVLELTLIHAEAPRKTHPEPLNPPKKTSWKRSRSLF